MKALYLTALLVIASVVVQGQNFYSFSNYLTLLKDSYDPEKQQEAILLEDGMYKNVPTLFTKNEKVSMEDVDVVRVITDKTSYNKLNNINLNLENVKTLIIYFRNQSDINAQINANALERLTNLRHVIIICEFDYSDQALRSKLPTDLQDVIFLHLKSVPS